MGLSLAILLFQACSAEYRLAANQGKELRGASLLLLFPDTLYLTNSKEYLFPVELDSTQLYRASIDSSDFLRYINPDEYLQNFKKQMVKLYQEYGFRVYEKDRLDSFLSLTSTAYILEFGQLEIQEWWKPFHDEELMPDDNYYTRDFVLNAVSLNAWTTLSRLNRPGWGKPLVFTSYDLSDRIDGDFFMNNLLGTVFYDYQFYPLKKERLPELIDYGAIDISLDLMDFIIDKNVETGLDTLKNIKPRNYYHYIPRSKRVSVSSRQPSYVVMGEL